MSIQKIRRIPIVNVNGVGDNIIVAAIPQQTSPEGRVLQQGRKIRIMSAYIEADGAGDLTISSGVAGARTALTGPLTLAVAPAVGSNLTVPPPLDWELGALETKQGEDLNLFTSAAMSLDGWLVVAEVV